MAHAQTLASYHDQHGHKSVSYNAFYQRLFTGWSKKEASTIPIQKRTIAKRRAKRK